MRADLVQKLRDRGADGYLVTKEANKRYLTGVTALMGNVFVTAVKSYIVTQARHVTFMQAQCPEFTVVRGGWDTISALCRDLGLNSVCFEDDVLPVRTYEILRAAGVPLTPSVGLLEGLRAVKTESEIAAIRKACAIADAAFEHIRTVIRVGVTEETIAAELDHHMRTHGASDTSFKTLVSSGARCYLPHSAATSKELADGDFVLMDFGAVYQGYCSDITRTVVVGHADERQRRIYGLVQTAQQKALDAIRARVLTGAADAVAREFIMANTPVGCYDYGLGHGIGIEVHEGPFMTPGSSIELREGHVVSVEPGIYIPDWGGIRIEDTVLVGRDGCEALTTATKELVIL